MKELWQNAPEIPALIWVETPLHQLEKETKRRRWEKSGHDLNNKKRQP
jgi:hypothetical protein